MNAQPLVSVLMTAWNREKYITEAIESVLASTYLNFELIIVDDFSEDETVSIAQTFAVKDVRILVHVNKENLGQFQNRNYAASLAKGEYIMYVDSDDTIAKDAIEHIVTHLTNHPGCNFGMIYLGKDACEPFVLSPEQAVYNHLFKKTILHIGPGGTILNRKFFTEIGGYPTSYGAAGDMYFNIKAASNTSIVFLPYNYLTYRKHQGQELNNQYQYLFNGYKYFNDILELPELPLTAIQRAWLSKKNKRRFILSMCKYFISSRNLLKTAQAINMAGFTFKDALVGVFHFN
ncbi:MAG: glycosyltransferase family A protein [Ginsengibacter sp.]